MSVSGVVNDLLVYHCVCPITFSMNGSGVDWAEAVAPDQEILVVVARHQQVVLGPEADRAANIVGMSHAEYAMEGVAIAI